MEQIQSMGTTQPHLASWPQSWIVLHTNPQTCCRGKVDRSADPKSPASSMFNRLFLNLVMGFSVMDAQERMVLIVTSGTPGL